MHGFNHLVPLVHVFTAPIDVASLSGHGLCAVQALDPNLLKLKQAFEIAAEKMGLLADATGEPAAACCAFVLKLQCFLQGASIRVFVPCRTAAAQATEWLPTSSDILTPLGACRRGPHPAF